MNYNFTGRNSDVPKSQINALVHQIIHSRDDSRDPYDQTRLKMRSLTINFRDYFCFPILAEAAIVRYPNLESLILRFMETVFSNEDAIYDFSMPKYMQNKLKTLNIRVSAKQSIIMQQNVAQVIGNMIAKCRNLESVVICKDNQSEQDPVDPQHEMLPQILNGLERLQVQLPKLHLQYLATMRSQHSPYVLDVLFSPLLNVRHLTMSISNEQIGQFPELIKEQYQGRCITSNLELLEIELYGDGYKQIQQVSFLRALHASMGKRRHLVVSWNWSMNQDMQIQFMQCINFLRIMTTLRPNVLSSEPIILAEVQTRQLTLTLFSFSKIYTAFIEGQIPRYAVGEAMFRGLILPEALDSNTLRALKIRVLRGTPLSQFSSFAQNRRHSPKPQIPKD